MTLRQVHRPTRVCTPLRPEEPEAIAAPPTLNDGAVGGHALQTLIPAVGASASMVMMIVLRNANKLFLVLGAVILVLALVGGVAIAVTQRGTAARTRRAARELYLDFLEKLRVRLRDRASVIREQARALDPEPSALLEIVRDPARLWERRRHHPDFLRVRVGLGEVGWFRLDVPPEQDPVHPYDPIMLAEAEAVVTHYSTILGMPITVDLDRAGQVAVIGDRAEVLAVARSMMLQLASLHAPDDLLLAAAFPDSAAPDWRGFDLLPHTVDARLFDGPVPARRVAASTPGLVRVLGAELADRASHAATAKRSVGRTGSWSGSRLVVFCDDYGHVAGSLPVPDADLSLDDLQVTTVHLLSDRLHEPSDVRLRITAADGVVTVTDSRATIGGELADRSGSAPGPRAEPAPPRTAVPDLPTADLFATVARTLTPLRLSMTIADEVDSDRSVAITELLGVDSVEEVSPSLWRPRSPRDFLRVPIGVDDFGAPLLLDLKESAELGMGPHGICIGATGSGKSEMLRTLVLALALSHAPEDLSMVLVDYKGGAAFAPFTGLPHVAGIIDNLAEDPQLTERARSSIAGEVVRRQEQLRDAGSSSISHYRQLRTERPELPPMPHLFVVIDEFGELLTAEPDFIDLLISIGRIGRSIGVHLLLSSQRIEAGKLRGLDTYLSYRIGLRTFSESESSVVLNTPDAFHLPAIPGYGYLKVDTSVYRRFRSGYVSGPVSTEAGPAPTADDNERPAPLLLPVYNVLQTGGGETAEDELFAPPTGRQLVAECVDRLRPASQARPASRSVTPVWLPPLPTRLSLARVIPDQPDLDVGARGAAPGGLTVPLGLLDQPGKQWQGPWVLDLARAGGHHAVIGAPGTGRSTFLRTMAASLALTHTPREVSIYGMDLTGGGLRRIEGFPHVGGVATRSHRDRLLRLMEELGGMVATREAVFRDRAIDSLGVLRSRHRAGGIPELVSAEVVLLVDGVGQLRSDFEELEPRLVDLLQRGGSFGLHVVLAMTRWNDLRMAQQPLIGSRFEFRLNDPADSNIGRKLNATLKADQPGRLLTEDGLFAQVALPVLEDTADGDLGEALEALSVSSAASWEGPAAAPIRLLPTDLDPAELPDPLDEPDALPFGLRQDTMEPALLELDAGDQHLLVFGDTRSGKTTALRTLVQGLLERYTAEELVVAVMDLRGDIAQEVPDAYLGGHAKTSAHARGLSSAIADELRKRLDPAAGGDTPDGAGSGPAAPGPRIVVVIDDFDILASGGSEPLQPLLPYLPSARDLRLHVWLARPVAGANRAMYDVGLQTVRDTGGTVLLLSGDRGEGQIMPGVYAEQMVPGRGRLVRRGGAPGIVQVAHSRPTTAATEQDPSRPARRDPHAA